MLNATTSFLVPQVLADYPSVLIICQFVKLQNIMRQFSLPLSRILTLGLCSLAVVLHASIVQGQLLSPPSKVSNDAKVAIDQMLNSEWSRPGADRTMSTFAKAPKNEAAVLLSFALNRFAFESKTTALETTEEVNQRFPENLDAWMLTLWYQALINKYDVSLTSIGRLQQKVEQQPDLSDEMKKVIYRRLGKLIGYFEGPVRPSVNEDLLMATTNKLSAALSPGLLKLFNESRASVKAKFEELKQNHNEIEKVELAKAQIHTDEEMLRLEQEGERLEQTESQLAPQRDTIAEEADAAIASLNQQASFARAQLNDANAVAFSIERDLAFVYAEWNRNHEVDYHGNDFFLSTRIRELEFSLAQARNSAIASSNQLAAIRNEIVRTRRGFAARIGQVNSQIKSAKKAINRNMGRMKRLSKGPKIPDGKKSARKSRRVSLRTYDDISLDLLKQQMLDAIK